MFLNEGIVTQVVDYEKMVVNIENQYNFQFSLQNMALAIHAKLGGAPWKLAVTDKKELVIGVGAFTNQGENMIGIGYLLRIPIFRWFTSVLML